MNVSNNNITIRWQAPECDGGKEVLGYWVEYRKSTESTWKKCNKERLKEKEFTARGLAEATEYEFRVFAENETGMSRPRRTATCIKTKLTCEYLRIYLLLHLYLFTGIIPRNIPIWQLVIYHYIQCMHTGTDHIHGYGYKL